MLKLLLKLLLLATLVYLFLLRRRRPAAVAPGPDPEAAADPFLAEETVREMVQDPVCGVFIVRASALSTLAQGRVAYFCSGACYRRFLSGPEASIERTA